MIRRWTLIVLAPFAAILSLPLAILLMALAACPAGSIAAIRRTFQKRESSNA
jgi:hypothetical protein